MTENFIEKLKNGDLQAYGKLVEEQQGKVLAICFKFLQNTDDARDTAQEVFIEVFRSMGSFRSDARLATWIYRIAVNRSIDAMRKQKRQKKLMAFRQVFEKVTRNIASEEQSEHPAAALEIGERNQVLRDALDRLPDNQKSALVLSKCDGLSNPEIAEILKVTVSSVESLIHRAKQNMRLYLGEKYARQQEKS
jgi:RNA polymerase sigma-70 factor (ECF subfamily)